MEFESHMYWKHIVSDLVCLFFFYSSSLSSAACLELAADVSSVDLGLQLSQDNWILK